MGAANRQNLSAARWTVRAVGDLSGVPEGVRGQPVPATVPGCVHTDLMDAGLIPDPAVGLNERQVQWVSWTDWRYECEFDAAAELFGLHEIDLVFECLDTIAIVELNGVEIGRAASEFMPHHFSATRLLKQGVNRLAVTFTSPLRFVQEESRRLGPRPYNGDELGWAPYNLIRKCASNFGWDWGPKVATCGVTGDVHLCHRESSVDSGFRESAGGRGRPTLPGVDSRSSRRKVEFDAANFRFIIDGVPTFIRGANWIPEGLWPRDRTRERVRARLRQAADANMNMIRVWGGGRYEPDWFYETCDELGLMVWQDFMFACACYPEEEPLRTLIEREARYQVARLSRHPCVVLWCGGNECHWACESWGFKERLAASDSPKTWGRHYWRELLPRIVREVDGTRPYWPDSPWSGSEMIHPNDADHGDRHTWDLMGPDFRNIVPRFCSEFGVQSPSNLETLNAAKLLDGGGISPELLARQRGPGGMERWYKEIGSGIDPAGGFENWHARAQEQQALWLTLAIDWLRQNEPRCMGALVWQLNDAWPGFSWSLIDSAGKEKPAYWAVKKAFEPRSRCL